MTRSAVTVGLPSPNLVVETGNRSAILPGTLEAETGAALLAATLSASLADLLLTSTAIAIAAAALDAMFAPVILSSTAVAIDKSSSGLSIGEITLQATAVVVPVARDGVYPWWWRAYTARILAEREARKLQLREELAIIGDGFGVMPMPIGRGSATHDPDADVVEWVTAFWLLAA